MIDLGSCISQQLIACNLFEKNPSIYKGQGITLNIVDANILLNLFNKAHYVKPILTHTNIPNLKSHNEKQKEPSDIYAMLIEQHYNKVHSNNDISITVTNPETLKNLNYTKYSVDRKYLQKLLMFLERLFTGREMSDVIKYFHMFKIDIEAISKLSQNTAFVNDLALIIDCAFDLNDHMYKEFYEDFKARPTYPFKSTLVELFLELRTHKIYLINFLRECIYLSQFKYFMHTSYVDSRGRIYTQAVYTNVHNYKLSKMVLKLYKPPSQKEEDILKAMLDSIQSNDVKDLLKQYIKENPDLNKLTQELYIQEISKYLKNVSIETIQSWLNNDNVAEVLNFISQNVKDKRELFFVHSMICHLADIINNNADPHISLWYGQDAKCSGLQMVSILFRSESLGELCNLMGEGKKDVYSNAVEYFTSLRKDLDSYYKYYSKHFNDITILHKIINQIYPGHGFPYIHKPTPYTTAQIRI